jgi:ubiquinone/menaquinone biosynthesis C-methylase UbiE
MYMPDASSAVSDLRALLGGTDLYLVDGILKGMYPAGTVILDAGCGEGRNIHWFIEHGYAVWGVDIANEVIRQLQQKYPHIAGRFSVAPVEELPYDDGSFNAVISSAVLHFASDEDHFLKMLSEMLRVLKVGGHLFIRMTTDIGIEEKVVLVHPGVYKLPDGSTRFLLTRSLLKRVLARFPVVLLDEFKTVNVCDVRSMCTLLLGKRGP